MRFSTRVTAELGDTILNDSGPDTFVQASLFAEIMYQLGEFLAIASPVVWLGAVLLLTRNARALTRIVWLLAGLVLVAPWPFILGGLA